MLMILVLVIAGGFGWVAYLARTAEIQRQAVGTITKVGGSAFYDWQYEGGEFKVKGASNLISDQVPWWPKWLVDRLGMDTFGSISNVSFRRLPVTLTADDIDAALDQVGHLGRLKYLTVIGSPVTDAGIAHVEGLSNLESLMLRGANGVGDAGVAHLARLTGLKVLHLENTQISDKGLSRLSRLARLEKLNLAGTGIGDIGLAHLGGLTRLEFLGLDGTKITDAGLAHIRGMTGLKELRLIGTGVSGTGLVELQKTLPNLNIEHSTRVDSSPSKS